MSTSDQPSPPAGGRSILSPLRALAAVCLIAPFVAMLWIPSFNKTNPKLLGFPFFYWYQLLWVIITAVLMIVAFVAMNRDRTQRRGAQTSSGTVDSDGPEAGQ
ncbi:DUF3311 domain-containing protein [Actinocrinis puniceicyclus]|uniref:DUF3311 domain-containing protein n=1 Tax=Actinocrinis puniceicyclus TaxID=977794 RepID=A0A8J7WR45_9ACTN|nr:DUF3311 domain-containing protein [Actinocrinis puniceicyclus]MBS2963889.1 DUF3311 domain-containing protein [Actinocrinis puniceicyclus]